jgi:hypothetical protein
LHKVRQILITLVFLFISSIFVDEGKTILLIGNNLQIHLSIDHHNDREIPHQHNDNKSGDDEKLVSLNLFDLSCFYSEFLKLYCNFDIKLQDFPGSIWQPPKSR